MVGVNKYACFKGCLLRMKADIAQPHMDTVGDKTCTIKLHVSFFLVSFLFASLNYNT